jgi:hypothetical protein
MFIPLSHVFASLNFLFYLFFSSISISFEGSNIKKRKRKKKEILKKKGEKTGKGEILTLLVDVRYLSTAQL